MEVKSLSSAVIKVEINERVYHLVVPQDAPLGELYDVLHAMLKHVADAAVKASDKVKRAEGKDAKE